MNKLFTKIAALALGATMAVGVGVAVASNKEATPVHAAGSSDWVQVTALSGLNTTDTYVIANDADKGYYMNGTVSSGHFQSTAFSASAPASATAAGAFKLEAIDASNNIYAIKLASTSKYVYATKAGSGGGSVTGSSDSSGWKFLLSGTSFNAIYQTAYSSKYAAMRCYSNTSWRTYSNNSATSISTTSGTVFRLYKYQSKTLSSIAVSGYKTSFTVGDSFSFGGTVTATYSDDSTANVTSSATFSGYDMSTAGNQTVTASYTEGGVTKTATYGITVSAATSPYINPAKASTSGYTGQNETLSFTYGNLTSTLGVSSSDTSVVTVGTPSASAGSGTVQINFVGAGSTTVKFKDGSTELASVSVSVTASSVTITGLPASKSISNGGTFNLGSLITVTATGSCSSDVTWESDDDSIVSVTSSGVITGESVGTTDVTVTSDDYPSATMTCSVTVANMISAVFGSGTTDGSGLTSDAAIKAVTGYTVDSNLEFSSIASVYGSTGNALKLGASSAKGTLTIGLVDGKVSSKNAYITKITVNAMAYGTDSTSITINGSSKTLTTSFADYDVDVTGTSTTSIAIEASAASKQRFRIQYINVFYDNPVELSSVTTSGQTTSFTAGNNFSYGGTLTAHYSDSSSATVTPTSFKYGASGIDPTSAGTTITTSTVLNKADHDGKYIYVIYTEDNITKYCSYQITVSYAAVTSVEIGTHAAELGLNEVFDYTQVTVTVNTQYADPGYEWVVSANTVSDDYDFDASGLLSGDTEGTVTLRCRSTADNTKYDELVVTITGDPVIDITPASVSGYVGKSADIDFTYGNINDEELMEFTSSNTSVFTVEEFVGIDGEGAVTINFEGVGSATLSASYDGGSTLDSITVTVSTDSVTALTWSAPTIKVYSGASTTVSDASSWNVHYTMASGDYGSLLYGEYTLKLGGSTITLPHTWDATDDGKVLSIEYAGFTSPTTSTVDVTQTLQAVNASDTSAWDYTFTAKAWSAAGSATLDDKEWTMSGTGNGYWGYDATKGQQFGSGSNPYSALTLSSSAFSGTIASVTVYTSGASSINATVQVSVGGTAYGDAQTITATNTPYTFDLGGKSGTISIDYVNSSSKAIYIKEIVVNTVSGSHNIANASGHEAAQKAVVKFAKAFNAAMDTTENCTTNMSSAWSTATTAWNTFTSEAAALGSAEEEYAKNLIKYATAQWTENTDSDYSYCLERAMATYEKCVSSYKMTAFMSTVRPVGRSVNINPISIIGSKSDFNVISIVVITSVISLTAIGGYFFLRKRKENI